MFERFNPPPKPKAPEKKPAAIPKPVPVKAQEVEHVEQTDQSVLELRVALHQSLIEKINLNALEKLSREDVADQVRPLVVKLLLDQRVALNETEFEALLDELLDEVLGLGPLEPMLKDNEISDILVNTHRQVFVERFGRLEKTPIRFKDDRHLVRIIQKMVSTIGRRVDESQPWVDARLPDGSRVNALLPPCAVDGPLVSIRKFSKMPYTVDRLVENGSITPQLAYLLDVIVKSRLNVLISGGTGTGKTTILNAMSSLISNRERIVTIEDTAELQLQQEHVARMESRPSNMEGHGEVSQRDLLKNSLRMRPDRIIVGEVRGSEVIDMLQAMNTGHDGSMTTVHANTARDALTRLEHMTAMAGYDIPIRPLRGQVAAALQVVIQLQRFADGRRRVVSVQEITGLEGDIVAMQEIYRFERFGIDENDNVIGRHRPTGIRPKFAKRAQEYGFEMPEMLFTHVDEAPAE